MNPSGDDDTVAATDASIGGAGAPAGMTAGDLIAGRYRITRFLGGGGMGNVYAAVDTELGEPLAIKMLRRDLTEAAVERFRGEVRLQRRITHKNVARIHDIGEHAGDKLLTMELVDGESLAARLERLGAMPLSELRKVAADVLAGLAAAHAAGVVHLDLKPANVLLARDGRAVIADFGIARAGRSETGEIAGTPAYMAPEQHDAAGELDARTDLYAFGVMLFELATGRKPFGGTTLQELAQLKHEAAPDPRGLTPAVPPAMVAMIQRCLAVDRADRPATADEVATGLERALRDAGGSGSGVITLPAPGLGANVTATIAVLPMTAAPGDEYLAGGLAEDLADALSRTTSLRVLPATAARGLAATGVDAGAALGVDHVVEGSLRRAGSKIRIAVRLLSVRDGFQIWADRRDAVEGELLAVGDELAVGLAAALSTAAASRHDEIDPRAVDLYLRARHHMREFWGYPIEEAIRLLEQAAEAAPSAPTIVSYLAAARVRHWMLTGTPESEAIARATADHAMTIGPFHGEARYARAQVRNNTGDQIGGATDLGAAIRLAPLLAEAHYTAGLILHEVGQHEAGANRFAHCLEIDPRMRPVVHTDAARVAALRGDHATSIRLLDDLVAGDAQGQVVRVVGLFRARLALWRGEPPNESFAHLVAPEGGLFLVDRLVTQVRKMAATGVIDVPHWREQLDLADAPSRPFRGRLISMQVLIEVAMAGGRHELALEGVERVGARGLIDVVWMRHCPLLAPFADEPRFGAVLAQVASRAEQIWDAYRAGLTGK